MVHVKGVIPPEKMDKIIDDVRMAPISESMLNKEPTVHDLEFVDLEDQLFDKRFDDVDDLELS